MLLLPSLYIYIIYMGSDICVLTCQQNLMGKGDGFVECLQTLPTSLHFLGFVCCMFQHSCVYIAGNADTLMNCAGFLTLQIMITQGIVSFYCFFCFFISECIFCYWSVTARM